MEDLAEGIIERHSDEQRPGSHRLAAAAAAAAGVGW